MRLVSATIAKNEADIIESFVRYHQHLFDHMLIINHDSTDDTGKILRSLAAEGLAISVFDDHSLAHLQGPKTTALARQAFAKWGAQFVFPLDADEIVKTPSRVALERSLSELPLGMIGAITWQNYIVSESDSPNTLDPVARIQHRAAVEMVSERKIVLPAAALRDPTWEISHGNHHLTNLNDGHLVAASCDLANVSLAHFALRDEQQMQRKILLSWLSLRVQNPVDIVAIDAVPRDRQSWHQRQMVRDLIRDPNFSITRIREMAWRYYVLKDATAKQLDISTVHEPITTNYSLRYTTEHSGSVIGGVARWADRLLTHIGSQMS
jgi:Glycosyl transferase family 2